MAELMNRVGYSTPTVAMRYQDATFERDQAIAEKLGALLRAAQTDGDDERRALNLLDNLIRNATRHRDLIRPNPDRLSTK